MNREAVLRICTNCGRGVISPFLRGRGSPRIYLCRNCGMEYSRLPSQGLKETVLFENPLAADTVNSDDLNSS